MITDPANHPANDRLADERLIRVRDELQRTMFYANGGDMAYVIADAIKGLEELLVSREAEDSVEPDYYVVVTSAGVWQSFNKTRAEADFIVSRPFNPGYSVLEIYTAPPAPVTPDGWIPVSERMPEREVDVQVYCSDKKEQMVGYMERNEKDGWFRFASLPNGGGVYCKPTHWQPLPEAPREVK